MANFIPPLFKKFGQGVKDLFTEQFEYRKYAKVKTAAANGVTLESTGEAVKGDFAGNLKSTYKQADIGTFETELNTSGSAKFTVKADKLTKGLTVKASVDEKPAGKLEVDFSEEFFSTSFGVDYAKDSTAVEGAAAVGFDGLSVGGAVKYDIVGQHLADYNSGIEYTQPDFTTTVKTTNQADRVQASYLHKVSGDLSLGGLFGYDVVTGKRLLTFGGSYKVDPTLTIKQKIDTEGTFATVLEQRISKAYAKVLISAESNLRNQSAIPEKFGLGFIFGDE